ncbi:retrovirus-related Pol polyprotein from transposon 17.6 [Trichonephila clavipes]|nr:retrovirus-related Pol polyprotein from transposon 17.6 [Trichonephila clavipes]
MMQLGHLRSSSSNYASPLHMVPKKGTFDWRPAGDYQEGIQPLPDKVKCITEFPKPSTLTQLRRFLGLFNFYRCFIPKAAHLLAPLIQFLEGHKNKKKTRSTVPQPTEQLQWNDAADAAFV